ncbi:STN domain-containing protein, partial [Mariniphaga sediminis]|uniref:STN domain-containing protein n=1 Tax=Mariniphaga sediminis TaxID=1628158 RepID=UPI003562F912
MKLTCLLITFALLQVSAETYSQTKKLTLNLKNTPLSVLFEEIEKTSEFHFFYDSGSLDLSQKVTVAVEDSNIEEVLEKLFSDSGISYEIFDRYIILKGEEKRRIREGFFVQQQQQHSVSGKVTDSGDEPLPGVTVVVKGTTQGTVTNAEGEYSLVNIPTNATLQFSFVGMRMQEVEVGNQTLINISMEEETFGLEEVVAIGYGTQKKVNVIGSVTTVNNDELTAAPVGRIANALTGRMPGATIMQSSGEPGNDAPSIRIRGNSTLGNNAPLIVVDGIPGRDLNSLHPEDIESITV